MSGFFKINFLFQPDGFVKIIVRTQMVASFLAANLATLNHQPILALKINIHRFHQAAAKLGPVARINIHVFGPETLGAVIGVAIAFDRLAAMFANKILHFFDKFGHKFGVAMSVSISYYIKQKFES